MSWYEVVSTDELMQGDVLFQANVPIMVPPAEGEDADDAYQIDIQTTDVIVLTQSCDLERETLQSVLVAQFDSWSSLRENGQAKRDDQKQIRSQRIHYYQLLPDRMEEPAIEWSIVDFRLLYMVPRRYLQQHALRQGDRLRLLPPYREGVAQAFARYIMRVAYDDDLNRFDNWRA